MLQILFEFFLIMDTVVPLHLVVALDQMQAEASEKQPLLLQDTPCLLQEDSHQLFLAGSGGVDDDDQSGDFAFLAVFQRFDQRHITV